MKWIGIICIAILSFSCSKDDDPADNDLFVGKYEGSVGFSSDDDNISSESSSVTVVKVGNNYNFNFNQSGIPSLTGVKFEKDGESGVINIDFEEGVQVVRISESKLFILYTEDGKTWTANCSR